MKPLKQLKDLTLLDRFLFSEVMENPQCLETVLEIILGRDVLLRCLPQTEKEQKCSPLYRHIRLDVWGQDLEGAVYDVEVQKKDTKNLCKRSRYYQGLIDGKLLEPGQTDFNELNDTYIIIIAPFDLFGKGRYQYTFEMRCREDPGIPLEDRAVRIFLNTHGRNPQEVSPELVELLSFIEHTNQVPADGYDSPKVRELQRQVTQIKSSEEIGVKFMQAWEERELDKQEAREEGRLLGLEEGRMLGQKEGRLLGQEEGRRLGQQEGLAQGKSLLLKNLIRKKLQKGLSPEEIADILEVELSTILSLMEEL